MVSIMGNIWLSSQGGGKKNKKERKINIFRMYASKQWATILQRIVSIQRGEE